MERNRIGKGVIPHSEVEDKPERGIEETRGAATLNGP